jgi:hypothetical protein
MHLYKSKRCKNLLDVWRNVEERQGIIDSKTLTYKVTDENAR